MQTTLNGLDMPIVYKMMGVDHILKNKRKYFHPKKRSRLETVCSCYPGLLEYIDQGGKNYETTGMYGYLYHRFWNVIKPTRRAKVAMKRLLAEIRVYKSIKKDGMLNPIDMCIDNGRTIIERGYRRINIAKHLGYAKVPCRIFESQEQFDRLKPSATAWE
jgi:hypothetical protein